MPALSQTATNSSNTGTNTSPATSTSSSKTNTGATATAALDFPAGLSMPWRFVGIDPLLQAGARAALADGLTAMRAAWLTNAQPLTAFIGSRRPVTINRKKLTDQIATGTANGNAPSRSIAAEPTWCSFMDHYIFAVTIADTKLNTLLGAAHLAIPRTRWQALGRSAGQFLADEMPKLTSQALAQAATKANNQATDALHVGLSLARNVTRHDEGFSLCVNMLVEQKLAPEFTVARALGTDMLATVRDALGQPAALRRPTRGLVLAWQNAPEHKQRNQPGPKRQLPISLNLTATMAETVFGQHIPVTYSGAWPFSVTNDQISFALDSAFTKLLTDERATLQLTDWPQAAHVYRAWVYLDRGRAWGLKINDRLIAEVDGQPVKGHVVRFFGPEAGLTSPRGFPIREGAIVYVRLNQRLARPGIEFKFDPRTYPTPYPMTAAATTTGK